MGARLDQHFLVDEGVRDAIVAAARVRACDRVLEIGPGRGILTAPLLALAAHVTVVEMDDRLAESAMERLKSPKNLTVIHRDFLKLDLGELGEGPFTVVSNLPYSVGAPILQKLLSWPHWTSAVLMFQKEVAERLIARPGTGDYGLLTLSVQLKASVELVLEARPTCFAPPPKVSSAVVRLTRLPQPLLSPQKEEAFFKLARLAFSQRRKMAAGVLAGGLRRPRAEIADVLKKCGIPEDSRPERISMEAFLRLLEAL